MRRRTRLALALAGWRPGRLVSSTAFQKSLEEMDYVVVPAAEAVLREFCGVAVGFERWRWQRVLSSWISANRFWIGAPASDPFFEMVMDEFRAPCLPPLRMDEYRRRIGCDLTPVGETHTLALYIAVGANHAIYGVGGNQIWLIGSSAIEALNRLVYHRELLQEID